jgi:hypothetical protein
MRSIKPSIQTMKAVILRFCLRDFRSQLLVFQEVRMGSATMLGLLYIYFTQVISVTYLVR